MLCRHHALVTHFFFFNDTATTEIYTLSLHDALPISLQCAKRKSVVMSFRFLLQTVLHPTDRKSTRLNSSHTDISYAVFCLKKHNSGGSIQAQRVWRFGEWSGGCVSLRVRALRDVAAAGVVAHG